MEMFDFQGKAGWGILCTSTTPFLASHLCGILVTKGSPMFFMFSAVQNGERSEFSPVNGPHHDWDRHIDSL